MEKLTRLEEVERVRHTLLLRERLGLDKSNNQKHKPAHEYTKSEKEVCNMVAKTGGATLVPSSQDTCEMTEKERELLQRCIRLIQGKGKDATPVIREPTSPSDEGCTDMSGSMISSIVSAGSIE